MRLVIPTDPGVVEINYTWLPTWIGLNSQLLNRLSSTIRPMALGKELNEATLDMLETELIRLLSEEFPTVDGFGDFLRGISKVRIVDHDKS